MRNGGGALLFLLPHIMDCEARRSTALYLQKPAVKMLSFLPERGSSAMPRAIALAHRSAVGPSADASAANSCSSLRVHDNGQGKV